MTDTQTNQQAREVVQTTEEDFLAQLRRVNLARYEAWVEGADAGIMFDAIELGGEVGELLNVVKKLEREERGWRGSRADPADFADECADVLICLDKLARRRGVDLVACTVAKFNATSEKVGLPHRLAALSTTSEGNERDHFASAGKMVRPSEGGAVEALRQRVADAATLLGMLIGFDELRPGGLADEIGNDGCHFQSAAMAGLITHAKMWLEPNAVADRAAAYRAALASARGAEA